MVGTRRRMRPPLPKRSTAQFFRNGIYENQQHEIDHRIKQTDCRGKDEVTASNLHAYLIYIQIVKEVTGKSFKTYVESVRIDKAELLLKNTDKTNIQIAAECGFCSENTFYRAFSRRHGTTPSRWVGSLSSAE